MTRLCPVCGLKVNMEILKGRIVLYNAEGNFHSCGKDGTIPDTFHDCPFCNEMGLNRKEAL